MRQDKRKTGDKQKGKQKGNQGQADDKTKKTDTDNEGADQNCLY